MKRWLRIAARLAWILLVLASAWLPEDRPAEGVGLCEYGGKVEGTSPSWTAPEGCNVCRVTVKAGTERFTFTADGTQGCHTVSGIGTGSASAYTEDEEGPDCHAISHAEFYFTCPATATPTATNTPTPKPTLIPPPTAETPEPTEEPEDPTPQPSPPPLLPATGAEGEGWGRLRTFFYLLARVLGLWQP